MALHGHWNVLRHETLESGKDGALSAEGISKKLRVRRVCARARTMKPELARISKDVSGCETFVVQSR